MVIVPGIVTGFKRECTQRELHSPFFALLSCKMEIVTALNNSYFDKCPINVAMCVNFKILIDVII